MIVFDELHEFRFFGKSGTGDAPAPYFPYVSNFFGPRTCPSGRAGQTDMDALGGTPLQTDSLPETTNG